LSVVNIVVPELGESVVEARIARWLKKEGDQVALGEALVELETEKIDLEVSADRAGQLTSIKHQDGADVKVGEVLPYRPSAAAPPGAGHRRRSPAAAHAAPKATPTAKNVAKEHAVSLTAVPRQVARPSRTSASSWPPPLPAAPPGRRPPAFPPPPGDRTEERVRMTKRAPAARRLKGRRTPPPCSPPSTRWT
jgi:2-oxoglutarate dehydrogenase E2 component (dihydrolipoamide succinyltransferase)